jgi:VanZ family protein
MKRKVIPCLFWIYATALFVGSIIPWSVSGKVNLVDNSFRIDYFLHFASFFGLTFLFLLYRFERLKQPVLYRFNYQLFFIPASAISIELLQWAIPGRSFNVFDIFADFIGIFLALAIGYFIRFFYYKINIQG